MKKSSVWAVAWTLFKVAQPQVVLSWFIVIFMELFQKPFQPFIFSLLLGELQKKDDYDHNTALFYAIGTCFVVLLQPIAFHQHLYVTETAGLIMRNCLCAAVYKKKCALAISARGRGRGRCRGRCRGRGRARARARALITRISHQGFTKTNTGKIMNIMTNDINRFDMECKYQQWISVDRTQLITIIDSKEEFIDRLLRKICDLTLHSYIAKAQTAYMNSLKSCIEPEKEIILQGDFAENFHWENAQTTLHPFVAYHCLQDRTLNNLNIVVISDSKYHSTAEEFRFLNFVVTAPLQCIIVSVILWVNVGPLPVIGILGLLITIPFQILFGKGLFKFRKKVMEATDARIKLIHEIITSIKIIKLYAWEDSFWKHLYDKRKQVFSKIKHEFKRLKSIAVYKGLSKIVNINMSNIIILFAMLGFVYSNKGVISVSKVYLTITMFYSVRYSMTAFFALGLNGIATIWSSLQRINKFLSIEEYQTVNVNIKDEKMKKKRKKETNLKPIISFKDVHSSWGKVLEYAFKLDKLFIVIFKLKDKKNVVKGISFELNPGDYLCVIGEVGSGKTSLLKTVLKELVINRGIVKVSGKIAYACQQSWIFADTLKNNIIFGSKYDKEKYQNVINTCCLCKDINDMPNGDETLVGERGIRLSGGQRARISLARALYYDADIYLLDDPLSAVDAEVGNSLYSQVLKPLTPAQLKTSTESIDFPPMDVIRSAAEARETASDNDMEVVIPANSPKGKKKGKPPKLPHTSPS
ncbi:Multidrug resistance-associated protein 4 [Nymphon striatum]|nr:Multidrug resistance-associated protein 4 [Nymphon striatum]